MFKSKKEPDKHKQPWSPTAGWIVFVLAIGLTFSTMIFASALMFEVIDHQRISEVPPNSSQVLIAIFSGIIGIVGSFIGYNVRTSQDTEEEEEINE